MSDLTAGPASAGAREGGSGPWNEGAPPPVLLAALAAAALIAVTLVALFGGLAGGGDDADEPIAVRPSGATPAPAEERVALTVSLQGGGSGEVRISPGEISCSESCEHDFATGTRVTVTADAATGSTFEGWSDACDGTARCSILMDEERSLSASFERERAEPQCVEGAAEDDPACSDEDLDAPPDEDLGAPLDEDLDALDGAPAPAAECADGRDNDGDGLTDTEQDPDCLSGDSESGTSTSPRPTRPQSDCRDGKDNDGDGLTDTAQDPNCLSGSTEAD